MNRSDIMRAVLSMNTGPELALRRALHRRGFRYRVCVAGLPGKPDIVFPRRRAIVFVHGCFWHGHDCSRGARIPRTNAAYWKEKRCRNAARDEAVRSALEALGWRVRVSWECDLKCIEKEANAIAGWLVECSGGLADDHSVSVSFN